MLPVVGFMWWYFYKHGKKLLAENVNYSISTMNVNNIISVTFIVNQHVVSNCQNNMQIMLCG